MKRILIAASLVAASATIATAQRDPNSDRGQRGQQQGQQQGQRPAQTQQPTAQQPQRPAQAPAQAQRPIQQAPAARQRPVIVFRAPPPPPVWVQGSFPYQARYHDTCQRKAWRLRSFERHAAADGYLSRSEQWEIRSLRRDLRRTCGDFRWRN